MLDLEMKNELKHVFRELQKPLVLEYDVCGHSSQVELLSMLADLAECSPLLEVRSSGKDSTVPSFSILRNGSPSGVRFRGIPGGHEFTSLVLALLHADGKGKQPDDFIRHRIRNLKGPIRLRTFVSLDCENCPDVVQTLNLFSLIHDDFHHEMIDGAFFQEEIARLSIQGVPSVMAGDALLHSGKIALPELLSVLEKHYGLADAPGKQSNPDLGTVDVAVVGGGPAGVSAAIYSARKGLKTALIAERIGGQVQETKGIENLISVPYTEGPELSAGLSKHLEQYPVRLLEHRSVRSISKDAVKMLELGTGETLRARSVIIATGAKWRELGIPGEKEYLGRGVAFCPHCDGPFYKGKDIAVIGGGNSGVEAAIDLSGIARQVTVVEFNDSLKADQVLVDKLRSLPNTAILTSARTRRIEGDGKRVTALVYENRANGAEEVLNIDGIFVQIGLLPNSRFLSGTVELTPSGEIKVDAKGRTSVPGIYAAGDVTTTPFKQIIIAMGEGAKAALAAFEDSIILSP